MNGSFFWQRHTQAVGTGIDLAHPLAVRAVFLGGGECWGQFIE
jgi:hypothetical protein